MKLIVIIMKMAQKRKSSLLLIMIEMVISCIVFASIAGKMVYLKESRKIADTFQGTNSYYYAPFMCYSDEFDIQKYMDQELREHTVVGSVYTAGLRTAAGAFLPVLGYTDVVISCMKPRMQSGRWFTKKEAAVGSVYPAVAVGSKYAAGDVVELEGGKTVKIIGTIQEGSYIVMFRSWANSGKASLEHFISKASKIALILPYGSETYHSLPVDSFEKEIVQAARILQALNQEFADKLERFALKYGEVSSIQQMQENYQKDNEEYYVMNGMILIIFSILTAVGMLGVNGIQSVENERTYTIYYMLGLNRAKCMLIEAVNTFLVVGLSYLVFLAAYYGGLLNGISEHASDASAKVLLLIFVYLLFLYAATSFSFIYQAGKHNVMELYKRGKL